MNSAKEPESAARAPVEVATVQDPVDVAVVADTIRSIRLRLYAPEGETLDALMDNVRGHVGLLVEEPLGPDDGHRYVIVRTARKLLADAPRPGAGNASRWQHVLALTTTCDALLRRWVAFQQPEGDYEVRCEPDGDGYYVLDSVSGCIATHRQGGIARPARRLPVEDASALASSLNNARENRPPPPACRRPR